MPNSFFDEKRDRCSFTILILRHMEGLKLFGPIAHHEVELKLCMAITWGPPDAHDLGGWTVDDTTPDRHSSVVFFSFSFAFLILMS